MNRAFISRSDGLKFHQGEIARLMHIGVLYVLQPVTYMLADQMCY